MIDIILKQKGIYNIQPFMNIIFEKVSEILKKVEKVLTIEKRSEIEKEINDYIEEVIKDKENYGKNEVEYLDFNKKLKNTNPNSFIELIKENYSPFENIYSEKEFPNLKYYLYSENLNIKEFKNYLEKQQNYKRKYRLLNKILEDEENIKLLPNILNINKLVNILYKKYNNNITRDKAKRITLKDIVKQDNDIGNLIKPFIEAWNEIKSKCTSYECHTMKEVLHLNEESTLNNFLPDKDVTEGNIYIRSAYYNFINWQNSFINSITNDISENSPIFPYISQLEQKINIFDANEDDIIKIEENINLKLIEMINKYSMRDIFKNNNIDFKGFKRPIKIDLNSIEKELVDIILPGIKSFENEDEGGIKFISYIDDNLQIKDSSTIFIDFLTKYSIKKLSDKGVELLELFLNQNYIGYKIMELKSSCENIINHIQTENYDENEHLFDIIQKSPDNLKFDENFK